MLPKQSMPINLVISRRWWQEDAVSCTREDSRRRFTLSSKQSLPFLPKIRLLLCISRLWASSLASESEATVNRKDITLRAIAVAVESVLPLASLAQKPLATRGSGAEGRARSKHIFARWSVGLEYRGRLGRLRMMEDCQVPQLIHGGRTIEWMAGEVNSQTRWPEDTRGWRLRHRDKQR